MKENLPETLEECFKILEENVNILEQLEMNLEDEKEDELVPDMELHNLFDMTQDVSESSKIRCAEFNLIKRQAEDASPQD